MPDSDKPDNEKGKLISLESIRGQWKNIDQEAVRDGFVRRQQARMERPLTSDEYQEQRGYLDWKKDLIQQRIDRGYLVQDAEIQFARDDLAREIREIRNEWTPYEWRSFVEQGGDMPATVYAADARKVEEFVKKMRSDWESQMSEPEHPEDERDKMRSKMELESDIFDIRNISLKIWNEREELEQSLIKAMTEPVQVDGKMISPFEKGSREMFQFGEEIGEEIWRTIAMKRLNSRFKTNPEECIEIIDWAKGEGYLNDIEAASLRKGKLPPSLQQDNGQGDGPPTPLNT